MKYCGALVALILSCVACAASPVATPAQVSSALKKQGAHAFFASLSDASVDKLLHNIGSGQSSWIAITPKLAEGADGGNAEGLGIALARALPKNASAVLKVANPANGDAHILAVSRVCSIPFIDKVPPAYKANALRAVEAVKDARLQRVKRRCLAVLNKS